MATNLALDDRLLVRAMKAGAMRTKRETVNAALNEFIERRQQKRILELAGKIAFRDDWNYKTERKGRECSR